MTVREAENEAARLLASSWWRSANQDDPLPVDPEDLARGLGIKVQEARLPSDESGNIVMHAEGDAVITLNTVDHPNRKRFTCAHEIGHYLRRRQEGLTDRTFVDYRATLAGLGSDKDEVFANQFAAALLMPARAVQMKVRQGLGVDTLAYQFGTSVQAMEVRLRNLHLA